MKGAIAPSYLVDKRLLILVKCLPSEASSRSREAEFKEAQFMALHSDSRCLMVMFNYNALRPCYFGIRQLVWGLKKKIYFPRCTYV